MGPDRAGDGDRVPTGVGLSRATTKGVVAMKPPDDQVDVAG
jgi:hypothetical protein